MRDWQRDDPAAPAAFRSAGGDVAPQADGTTVNTASGWREMRLSILAGCRRGEPAAGAARRQRRDLPRPHARVARAAIRTGERLGPGWRRMAPRLGPGGTSSVTALAGGARRSRGQSAGHPPGVAGVLGIYHARGRG